MGEGVSIGRTFLFLSWAARQLGVRPGRIGLRLGFHTPEQGTDVDFVTAVRAFHSPILPIVRYDSRSFSKEATTKFCGNGSRETTNEASLPSLTWDASPFSVFLPQPLKLAFLGKIGQGSFPTQGLLP